MTSVTVADVFARDGLQALRHEGGWRMPTTDDKVAVIAALDAAGVPEIEITGFAHPRVIPSLADAELVAQTVLGRPHRAVLRALVPNLRGAERALDCGVAKLVGLVVLSETYERLNANRSVADGLAELARVAERASRAGAELAVGVATAFHCPYEGLIGESRLFDLLDRVAACGVTEVVLADSVGLAGPGLVRERCLAVRSRFPQLSLGLHLHNLGGFALASAFAALEAGVDRFDGSVGGIGSGITMPLAAARLGNVATEDLVALFESVGATTGIDPAAIADLGGVVQRLLGAPGASYAAGYGTAARVLEAGRAALPALQTTPPGVSRLQEVPR
ncbi:MAG TPA: hydroxymethylglutaryl-CoA lyase [Candidatus Micrarchaeia archaeon]|nr:hydroxymethylglutaryl-CoA lyase [Candidatus Micrarchaeia archaeon]